MNVVDSSAWLEYFGDGPNAPHFARAIEEPDTLVVPTLSLYEVFKRVAGLTSETSALEAIGVMLRGDVVELSPSLALESARLSLQTGLSMADSVMLASARSRDAVLWTQDAHFEGMEGVEYRRPAKAAKP